MSNLREMLDRTRNRQFDDAERYDSLDPDECQLCGAYGADKRTLRLSCFYAVHEVVPEAVDLAECNVPEPLRSFYYLRICKNCRGELLSALGEWRDAMVARRDAPKDHDGHDVDSPIDGRCIPVRENGRVVYLTEAEWEAREAQS